MEATIELDDVRVEHPARGSAGPRVALAGVSLRIAHGETLGLIGPSGSGKTTTLRLVNRLVEPSAGRVRVGGRDVRDVDPVRLRRGIGYVIQASGLFPHLTVENNVGLLARLEGHAPEAVAARVAELLALVRLDPQTYAKRLPHELSGGERQRVGVARALMLDPPIVLMDEPFGALDPLTRRELQAEVRELQRARPRTVVFVSHDLEEAFSLADRVAILEQGRLVRSGTRAELEADPGSDFVRRFLEAR